MEKEAVLKKLKEKRRLLQEDIWRRDLFVGFGLLFIFAVYLNLGYFGILPADRTLTGDIVTILILFFILVAGVGVCHYFSYQFFNKKYAEEVEERIENQSGFFLRFLGKYALSPEEKQKIETFNRLVNVTKCQKIEVSCINDYVNIYVLTYGSKENALLIQTKVLGVANTFSQLRNDVRVMSVLHGESTIKTYYPESDGFMHSFVGFSSQKPGSDGFFTPTRREIIRKLSDSPQYKYCLTETENDVTLLIDGLTLRFGDNLMGVFDDARFSRHLAIRKLIQMGVDAVSLTAHTPHP